MTFPKKFNTEKKKIIKKSCLALYFQIKETEAF